MPEADPTPGHPPPPGVLAWARISEWWEFKLAPPLAIAYAAALHAGSTPWGALAAIGLVLTALVPGAIFVSVLNDLTDRADDARAGKPNRQTDAGRAGPVALIGACLAAGIAFMWLWRDDLLLVASYGAGWLAYAAYSIPPLRTKQRGLAGALCDAIGANVVPALLAALLVARELGAPPAMIWLGPIALWALCFGLRGILWHQMGDLPADLASGTRTAVVRLGPERVVRLAKLLIFPVELAMACLWLPQAGPLALGMSAFGFALYFHLLSERIDRFEMSVTLVRAQPRSFLMLHEFYDALLPLALLLAGAITQPLNLLLAAAHVALFPRRIMQLVHDLAQLRDPRFESRSRPPRHRR